MIASKQIAFGGSKRKPYDAEVEYLESTGTQYIDTGVVISEMLSIDITFVPTIKDRDNDSYLFGCFYTNDDSFLTFVTGEKGVRARWGSNASRIDLLKNRIGATIRQYTDNGLVVLRDYSNNETVLKPIGNTFPHLSFCLFGANSSGVKQPSQGVKIFGCKLGEVLDLIPVRVGSVGYMYDKVSGKLFGNAGTGAFILGADAVSVNGGV